MDPELAEKIYELDRCIECGCCVAACGTARMREDFVGRGGPQQDRALPPRSARQAHRRRLLRADRRRRRRVRLHVAARLPRRVPEGPAAATQIAFVRRKMVEDRLEEVRPAASTPSANDKEDMTMSYPHREGLPRREADPRRRVLRRADAARQGELPHHRHPDVAGAELRQGVRLREEGGGARQPRPGCSRQEDRRRDRRRLRPADRRRDARPVRHRLHPGRRRHLDQHERERGDRQPRARGARPQEGRVPVRQPERPRELRAVDERHLSDGVPARADPAARELHGARSSGCRTPSTPRRRSSTRCSRWAARTCRTRCRCRSARSSTAGARRSARRCSASPRSASSCTRSTSARRRSAPR